MNVPPRRLKRTSARPPRTWPRIAIIGGGISGICAGIRFKQAGIDDFVILEKADRIGGTWRDNCYPGAACDIPSHLYSFSFASNGNWSRKYPSQPEILSYLEDCIRTFGIADHIRFGAEVVAAGYQGASTGWLITLSGGEAVEADVLVAACGQLHHAMVPDIPGRDSFAGPTFHSAHWREDCDISGRSVGIVGSAASAVQIAPAIASKVRDLTIFQRSANWIFLREDRAYSAFERRLFSRLFPARMLYRAFQYWSHEILVTIFRSTGPMRWLLTGSIWLGLKRDIADERMRKALVPNYTIGCKRVLRAPDYVRMLRQDRATVVTAEIDRITPDGIHTCDGTVHRLDVIVFATGFKASAFLMPIEVRGRGGVRLADRWSERPEAYLGMAVPGFPNFFILYGPNTSLGHNSVIFMIECQVEYIKKLLQRMRAVGANEVEVRAECLSRFMQRLSARMRRMVWSGDCQSYYKNDNGHVVGIWPYSTLRYWWATRKPRLADYVVSSGSRPI